MEKPTPLTEAELEQLNQSLPRLAELYPYDVRHQLGLKALRELEWRRLPKEEQPPPQPNDEPPIWPMVIADLTSLVALNVGVDESELEDSPTFTLCREAMEARHQLGLDRYGTPLQPNNGRDNLQDLSEELLDACAYAKTEIVEAEQRNDPAEDEGLRILQDLYEKILTLACESVLIAKT